MFCTNCGNPVPDGARFCEQCGAMMGSPAPVSQPAPQSVPQPAPQSVPRPAPQHTEYAPYAPAPVAEPVVDAPAAPAKKKKKLLPIILILAVVMIAAAVAAVVLFGPKTVYLVTENVNKSSDGSCNIQRYEYDDEGRITKYEYEYQYPEEYEYADGFSYEISYAYSKDGKLERAVFDYNGSSFEVEYIYKKDVLDGFEFTDGDSSLVDMDLDVECDDEGRFESIRILSADGNEVFSWKFKYYDDGTLKKSTQSRMGQKTIAAYNQDGRLVEQESYWNDELLYRTVYDYDEAGRQILVEQYDSDNELKMRQELTYTFNKKQLTALSIRMEGQNDDGDTGEAEIIFKCEWDDLECTLAIDEINGDDEVLEDMGFEPEDLEIIFQIDKHGNVLETEISMDGETMSKGTNEYEAIQVSRSYKEINFRTAPLYLYFLLNL